MCCKKEVIGGFSEILVAKTGVWPIFQGQKPYMNNIRQLAHGIFFIKILTIAIYMKEHILMISGPEKMGRTNKRALLVRNCSLYTFQVSVKLLRTRGDIMFVS